MILRYPYLPFAFYATLILRFTHMVMYGHCLSFALMPSVDPVFPRPSAGLSMSPPISRDAPFRVRPFRTAARRALLPASLGPDNASGEARSAYRHGTSPLAFVNRSAGDQPVFCRPAATPETVHRMR